MEIIRFPEYDEVFKDVEELKKDISLLIEEKDTLTYTVCKNIETAYMLAVGGLEYKVYEAECLYRRLRRKLQLIRRKTNRQEQIELAEIESQLDGEMEEYRKILSARMKAVQDALERERGDFLSDEDMKELKELYRTVVKALHPDLHPDLSEDMKELFLHAVNAYQNGDVDALRLISVTVGTPLSSSPKDSFAELLKTRDRLFAYRQRMQKEIEIIKGRFPYNKKDFVKDPKAIEERKDELESAIFDYRQLICSLEEKIKELTENEQ